MAGIGEWDMIDLNDYDFSYYDYKYQNKDDDYKNLLQKIINNYNVLIFATPVYWYSMSGIMKVFFDRISDLLEYEAALGRKLKGKCMAALSCSVGNNLGENFWLPFSETAKYLGMNYLGHIHTIVEKNELENIEDFVTKINKYSFKHCI